MPLTLAEILEEEQGKKEDASPEPKKTNGSGEENPFKVANAVDPMAVADWMGITRDGDIPSQCPVCGQSGGTSVRILDHGLNCRHSQCKKTYSNVDLTMAVRDVSNVEAVNLLAEQFGFRGVQRRREQPEEPRRGTAPQSVEPENDLPTIEWASTDDIFAPLPPVAWVVKDIYLAPGRPALLAGYGYSGKSVAAQSKVLSVAAGLPVWGQFRVSTPGRVLHFDHEQGRHATNRRYQRLAYAMGIGPADLEDRLRVTYFPPVHLSDAAAREVLLRECDGVQLAIVDSLRATTPGIDENDSIIRAHLDKLTYVSEQTGCAFVIVHHAGKGKTDGDQRETARGSSAIFDACGLVLVLRQWESEDEDVTISRVKMAKSPAEAEGGARADFFLRIEDVADNEGGDMKAGLRCAFRTKEQVDEPQSPKSALLATERQIVDALRDEPKGVSTKTVMAMVGKRYDTTTAALEHLESRGRINRQKDGQAVLWSLEGEL